jgi:hypothetical protein
VHSEELTTQSPHVCGRVRCRHVTALHIADDRLAAVCTTTRSTRTTCGPLLPSLRELTRAMLLEHWNGTDSGGMAP